MKKKQLFATLVSIIVTSSLVGCGASQSNQASVATDSVRTITVSTTNLAPSIAYIDENDQLTGYDIEVLRAIDELLPEYEFEYWPNSEILTPLQTGKAQIAACQLEYSEERAETYLYPEQGYGRYDTYITIDANRNDINSIEDLAGKTVQEYLGGNAAAVLDKYNKEHPDNQINLELLNSAVTLEERIASIQSGKWDAFCITARDCATFNEQAGEVVFKQVGDPVTSSETYFVLPKGEEELAKAIDEALVELKANGTLTKLSIKFLGDDYSGSNQ